MACEHGQWSLRLVPKDAPDGPPVWRRYVCRNWRHGGECAKWVSQHDFARIRAALEKCDARNVVLLVLTLDPGRCAPSLHAQYRGLEAKWKNLRRALVRGYDAFPGVGSFDFVSVVEAQRSGRPHLNVIVHSAGLAAFLRAHPPTLRDMEKNRGPHWFRDLVSHFGWGAISYIGAVRSKDFAAAYVSKFTSGWVAHPCLMGEVAKLTQLPTMAPRRMRRMRSSKGFLPKRVKEGIWTGRLEMHPPPDVMLERQAHALRALLEQPSNDLRPSRSNPV